jgi:acyl-CoA synthetase (AMP-forming)/AMP-acid ligase II
MAYEDQLVWMSAIPNARQMKSITPTNANATPTAKALREFVSPMLCLHSLTVIIMTVLCLMKSEFYIAPQTKRAMISNALASRL